MHIEGLQQPHRLIGGCLVALASGAVTNILLHQLLITRDEKSVWRHWRVFWTLSWLAEWITESTCIRCHSCSDLIQDVERWTQECVKGRLVTIASLAVTVREGIYHKGEATRVVFDIEVKLEQLVEPLMLRNGGQPLVEE